jgi:hypothetical protein
MIACVWNVENLGGGFRNGPRRREAIMDGIARTLAAVRPHVAIILEVMRPRVPEPVLRVNARSNEAGVLKATHAFIAKWLEWHASTVDSTGVREVRRIVESLHQLGLDYDFRICETLGESYAVLYRSTRHFTIKLARPPEQMRVGVPGRYRGPGFFFFDLLPAGAPHAVPLIVVALHAPSPSHPVADIVKVLNATAAGLVRLPPGIAIVGMDTNLDPSDSGQRGLQARHDWETSAWKRLVAPTITEAIWHNTWLQMRTSLRRSVRVHDTDPGVAAAQQQRGVAIEEAKEELAAAREAYARASTRDPDAKSTANGSVAMNEGDDKHADLKFLVAAPLAKVSSLAEDPLYHPGLDELADLASEVEAAEEDLEELFQLPIIPVQNTDDPVKYANAAYDKLVVCSRHDALVITEARYFAVPTIRMAATPLGTAPASAALYALEKMPPAIEFYDAKGSHYLDLGAGFLDDRDTKHGDDDLGGIRRANAFSDHMPVCCRFFIRPRQAKQ